MVAAVDHHYLPLVVADVAGVLVALVPAPAAGHLQLPLAVVAVADHHYLQLIAAVAAEYMLAVVAVAAAAGHHHL